MFAFRWRSWVAALPLLLLVGCFAGNDTGDIHPNYGNVEIRAQYEKRILTPTGFSGTEYRAARNCYVELFRNDNTLLASGYLGSDGRGFADVATGTRIWARVYARYSVPTTSGGTSSDFFMRGSVVNARADQPFDQTADWYVDGPTVTVDGPGTLTITAPDDSHRSAGAFNIADQAVGFASRIRDLEPALRLPNLHTYWNTSTNPAAHERTYPEVLFTTSNTVYKTQSGRAVFTHAVMGCRTGAPDTETDEYDDAVLQETFSHLLFADYSYRADGSSALSLLRRDNDNAYVSRYRPMESTVAFVGGFCDFLAGSFRNDSRLMDSYVDSSGHAQVDLFDLSRHDQVEPAHRTEFTRGSIAATLWGIQGTLGSSGLQTLWNAARSNTALADGTGEFNGATLGCYPSFLTGVKTRASGAWTAIVTELAREDIPEPTGAYFNGPALYITQPNSTFTVTGTIRTYAPAEGRYYDRDQGQAYRFSLPTGGTRTITVTPTDGQDIWVELLGPGGWWGGKTNSQNLGPRTFTVQNLPAGVYAVRVRAGNTTATTTAGYTLTVQ